MQSRRHRTPRSVRHRTSPSCCSIPPVFSWRSPGGATRDTAPPRALPHAPLESQAGHSCAVFAAWTARRRAGSSAGRAGKFVSPDASCDRNNLRRRSQGTMRHVLLQELRLPLCPDVRPRGVAQSCHQGTSGRARSTSACHQQVHDSPTLTSGSRPINLGRGRLPRMDLCRMTTVRTMSFSRPRVSGLCATSLRCCLSRPATCRCPDANADRACCWQSWAGNSATPWAWLRGATSRLKQQSSL